MRVWQLKNTRIHNKLYDQKTMRPLHYVEERREVKRTIMYTQGQLDSAISQPSQEEYMAEDEGRRLASWEFATRSIYLASTSDDSGSGCVAESECLASQRLLLLPKEDMGFLALQHLRQWFHTFKIKFEREREGLSAIGAKDRGSPARHLRRTSACHGVD